ncbi:MAG: putative 2-oxoglutarate/Fe(II)-dependent dioxygenase YbiX [Arenicella sp.]|jgi:predicted 2-oxoglutarate/Fe(II)-dependent dioxygenase YbiX
MPPISVLRKLGLYIDEQFLPSNECEKLCSEMQEADKNTGNVYSEESKHEFADLQLRKTQTCLVSQQSQDAIASRILAIKPHLQEVFQEQYADVWGEPKFLEYKTGDYVLPHTDDRAHRRLNNSIYLNSQSSSAKETGYCGGELTLYGLIKSPGWQNRGITVPGVQGMLVAYPVNIQHQVTTVDSGSRYAIVSRFLSPSIRP